MERRDPSSSTDSDNYWKYAAVVVCMIVLSIFLVKVGNGLPSLVVIALAGFLAALMEAGVTTVEAHRRLLRKTRRIIGRGAWYAFVGIVLFVCLPLGTPQAYRNAHERWLRWRNDPVRIAKRGRRAIDSLAGRTWW